MTEEEIKQEIRIIVKKKIEETFDTSQEVTEEEKNLIINSNILDGIIEDVVDDYWESSLKNWEGEVTKDVIAKVIEDDKINTTDNDDDDDYEIGGPLNIFEH